MNFPDFDVAMFLWINTNSWHNTLTDGAMIVLSSHLTWALALTAAFAAAFWRRDQPQVKKLVVLCVAVAVVDGLAAYFLKPAVGRLRPCHELAQVILPTGKCGGLYSFPSNHALNAGMVFGLMTGLRLARHWLAVSGVALLAGLVALSRVWLGVHYPLDVTVGLVTGSVIGLVVGVVVCKLAARSTWLEATQPSNRILAKSQTSSGKNKRFSSE